LSTSGARSGRRRLQNASSDGLGACGSDSHDGCGANGCGTNGSATADEDGEWPLCKFRHIVMRVTNLAAASRRYAAADTPLLADGECEIASGGSGDVQVRLLDVVA